MKAFLIILLIVLVIMLLPIGVDGGYSGGGLIVGLKLGPFNIKLFPRRSKTVKPKKIEKQQLKRLKKGEKSKETKKPPSKEEILDYIKLGLEALGRLRRRLNIDLLRFKLVLATGDPFETGLGYAAANALAGAYSSLFDRAFNIKERDYGVRADFLSDKTTVDFWLTATINLWDLLYIGMALSIDYLKMTIKNKRSGGKNERNDEKWKDIR